MGRHGTAISCQSRIKSLTSCWVEKKHQNSGINIINVTYMLPFIVPESFTNWWTLVTLATLAWIDTKSFHLTHL
jgi:hypothetical protein